MEPDDEAAPPPPTSTSTSTHQRGALTPHEDPKRTLTPRSASWSASWSVARSVAWTVAWTLGGCGDDPTPAPRVVVIDQPDAGPDASELTSEGCARPSWPERLASGQRVELRAPEGVTILSARWEGGAAWSPPAAQAPTTWSDRAPYTAQATTSALIVELSCDRGTSQATLRAEQLPMRWRSLLWSGDQGPTPREHALLWHDPEAPQWLYLYGGFTFEPLQFTASYDLWRLGRQTGRWERLSERLSDAPVGAGGRLVRRPDQPRRWLLVGGDDPRTGASNQGLHELSLAGESASWRLVDQTSRAVQLQGLILDQARQRLVVATGIESDAQGYALLGQLLQRPCCEGASPWSASSPSPSPSARYGALVGHDEQEGVVWVYSGAQAPSGADPVNAAQDLWQLDLTRDTWRRVEATGQAPRGRRNGCGFYDARHKRLFVFGGTADGATAEPGLHVLHLDEGRTSWHRVELPDEPTTRASCSSTVVEGGAEAWLGLGNDAASRFQDLHQLVLDPRG